MVKVAVPADEPAIATGLDEPKLSVGGSEAPEGPEVMAAASVTFPVNPPAGVTVIVDILPVVAPDARETAVPWTTKLGFGAAATVIGVLPVALL
jgi:hypothetical protein